MRIWNTKRAASALFAVGAGVVGISSLAWACSPVTGGAPTDPVVPLVLDPPAAQKTAPATVTVTATWPGVFGNYSGTENIYMDTAYCGLTGCLKAQRASNPGACQQVVGDSTDVTLGTISWNGSSPVATKTLSISPPVMGGQPVTGVFEVCAGAFNDGTQGNRPTSSSLKAYFTFI